jgi:hypothetical protein
MLREISRTHMKNFRIFVNKFGQTGVYIASKSVERARNRGVQAATRTQARQKG